MQNEGLSFLCIIGFYLWNIIQSLEVHAYGEGTNNRFNRQNIIYTSERKANKEKFLIKILFTTPYTPWVFDLYIYSCRRSLGSKETLFLLISIKYLSMKITWNCNNEQRIYGRNTTTSFCSGNWLFCTSWFVNKGLAARIKGRHDINGNTQKAKIILNRCVQWRNSSLIQLNASRLTV